MVWLISHILRPMDNCQMSRHWVHKSDGMFLLMCLKEKNGVFQLLFMVLQCRKLQLFVLFETRQ